MFWEISVCQRVTTHRLRITGVDEGLLGCMGLSWELRVARGYRVGGKGSRPSPGGGMGWQLLRVVGDGTQCREQAVWAGRGGVVCGQAHAADLLETQQHLTCLSLTHRRLLHLVLCFPPSS